MKTGPASRLARGRTWASSPTLKDDTTFHQLAPYIGRMKTSMARSLLGEWTSTDDVVVDPFCGCGVVALEAASIKREVVVGDTLIHAPGFEDRTMGFIDDLRAVDGARALLLRYHPENASNRLEEVRQKLNAIGIPVGSEDVLEYDRFDPGDFSDLLCRALERIGTRRVFVDISSMSKLAILLILDVCGSLRLDTKVLYCEAKSYGPSRGEFIKARDDER